ncbi:MAG TPA: TetR/AcrR family transcriptional regulator [Pseudonocardia sp.]|uniref:TetR/AcrR family transcriptional regulator n=1 Tax=Pseudonocardia sp. TaxID=60912 RepID=UPI002B4B532D|nr:TetR/AcrR family transcriptional regulator [Pseudonocardia sp.]HLU60269.1 TetR/AcrR family transcriptional regulator [Pseudonocardia sp.]
MSNRAAPTTRTRNRWGEGERLRTEILSAASRLLSELDDEDALTIRGVARATGIAPASIYSHFADRAALLDGLLAHEIGRLRERIERAGEGAGDDPVERVGLRLRAYCEFAASHPGHYRILFRRPSQAPPSAPSPVVEIVALFQRSLEEAEAAGRRLRLPADRAAVVLFTAAHGRMALYQANPTERSARTLPRFVDELVALVLD